jgi:hypothetical protein
MLTFCHERVTPGRGAKGSTDRMSSEHEICLVDSSTFMSLMISTGSDCLTTSVLFVVIVFVLLSAKQFYSQGEEDFVRQ